MLLGAPADDQRNENAGAAYVFARSGGAEPTATRTDPPAESSPQTSSTPQDSDDDFPGWPQMGGLGSFGFVVGFLIGNADNREVQIATLGLLGTNFGGGFITSIVPSEVFGWLAMGARRELSWASPSG